jgi:integrase
MRTSTLPAVIDPLPRRFTPPLIEQAGNGARFAWDEWFSAEMRNSHTRRAYGYAVRQFLAWCEAHALALRDIAPGHVGDYYNELRLSVPSKNQHLSAIRCFFDRLVLRHAVLLNPTSSVRGERYSLSEGKTPEITVRQERKLLKSIRGRNIAALRDRAIAATLIYTAARIGAVAALTVGSFIHDGRPHRAADDRRRHAPDAQAPHAQHSSAGRPFPAFVPRRRDYGPAQPGRSPRGRATARGARGPADNQALRPQEQAHHAQCRRKDFRVAAICCGDI